jgi:hypothetical protein
MAAYSVSQNIDTCTLKYMQATFVAQRAHIILLLHSVVVSIVMIIDFSTFVWLHIVASELDFLCSANEPSQECGLVVFDTYMNNRAALLATIIGLHALLTVSVCACMYYMMQAYNRCTNGHNHRPACFPHCRCLYMHVLHDARMHTHELLHDACIHTCMIPRMHTRR